MGRIIPIQGTSLRLVEMVTPDIAKAIKHAKNGLRMSEHEELISFYQKALCLCCGSTW